MGGRYVCKKIFSTIACVCFSFSLTSAVFATESIHAVADQYKSNNTFGTATSISVGKTIYANIHAPVDIDYYKIKTSVGLLTVNPTNIPAGKDYNLELYRELYNGKKVRIASSYNSGTTPEKIQYSVYAGTYYIKVVSASASGSGVYYKLSTTRSSLSLANRRKLIVSAAEHYLGASYSKIDCSDLCERAYKACGFTTIAGSSVAMAEACRDNGVLIDRDELRAGDLIFFAQFDPDRGSEYCGSERCCKDGEPGKCERWQHIHHVAIYVNDKYLIDSGSGGVRKRAHWGIDTEEWKWVYYARPNK